MPSKVKFLALIFRQLSVSVENEMPGRAVKKSLSERKLRRATCDAVSVIPYVAKV